MKGYNNQGKANYSSRLPYYSPHKYRHGHATYAISKAVTVADLKAISQNLMHTNLSITDGVYAIYSERELGDRIGNLGKNHSDPNQEILKHLETVIELLGMK